MIEVAQGADIDAVAGATITTAGVKQAVADALAQGGDCRRRDEIGGAAAQSGEDAAARAALTGRRPNRKGGPAMVENITALSLPFVAIS